MRKRKFLEIFEDEHPKLFDFIDKVCEETGAEQPKHVYVDYRVNAGRDADTSRSFTCSSRRAEACCIGLGLVNCVNLTEFKAVLAHEFGHFSQKSMKLGTYVYVVHRDHRPGDLRRRLVRPLHHRLVADGRRHRLAGVPRARHPVVSAQDR